MEITDKRYILIGDKNFDKLDDHVVKFGQKVLEDPSTSIPQLIYCAMKLHHKCLVYAAVLLEGASQDEAFAKEVSTQLALKLDTADVQEYRTLVRIIGYCKGLFNQEFLTNLGKESSD